MLVLFVFTHAWADHGAPAPQLGGTVLCVEPSSVQIRLEAETLLPAVAEQVRAGVSAEIFAEMQTRLVAEGVPYGMGCAATSEYVLLGLEARFLDPETYQGFPEASYTYVTTAQVGSFVKDANPDTALPERRYTGSASDIFQARTPEALEARLTTLGREEVETLVQAWLEANVVTPSSILRFAALGLVLALLRAVSVSFRAVRERSSSLPRPK